MTIPKKIEELAHKIRTAIYGKDVREALASGIEAAGETAEDARKKSEETASRQDALEQQFDDLIANMSLEDPSSAELVAARTNAKTGENWSTIGRRLDDEHAKLVSQLAQKATKAELYQSIGSTKTYLDNQLSQLGDMTPKSAFPTLQDLENTYPNGAEGIYLVGEYWYYWNILSSKWTIGGTYQALPWDEFMTEEGQEWVV